MKRSHMQVLVLGLGILVGIGCGGPKGPATYSVSGKVTMAGKPVENGQIRFAPGPGQPNSDPAVAMIKQGDYTATVTVGAKRVEIEVYTPTGPLFDGKPTNAQVAPAQYNSQSTLTAEIKAGANKDVNFTLE